MLRGNDKAVELLDHLPLDQRVHVSRAGSISSGPGNLDSVIFPEHDGSIGLLRVFDLAESCCLVAVTMVTRPSTLRAQTSDLP